MREENFHRSGRVRIKGRLRDQGAVVAGMALILVCGCSGLYSGPPDAGDADSGVVDAGGTDSGVLDAGGTDSGVLDAGGACDAGFQSCSGSCAPDSVTQCGPACTTCPTPLNGLPLCTGGACGFLCASPLLKCGTGCCKAVAVTAGYEHSCVITDQGGVKCWGSGAAIGDGLGFGERLVSVDINVGGDAGVAQLSASFFNTCARLTSGSLRCWGNNAYGSIGDGTTFQRTTAVEIFGEGVVDVSLGGFFSCALVADAVRCWGSGMNGQLGNGATADLSSPGPVSGLPSGVSGLWAGYNTACVATDAGFRCWGANGSGQCGDGTKVNPRLVPVIVNAVDAGMIRQLHPSLSASCALTTASGVKCFGINSNGELGDGTISGPRLTAVDAIGLSSGVTQLVSGSSSGHFCAVQNAAAYCWGLNDKGQLGDTTVVNKLAPTQVYGLNSGVRSLALGEKHSCAVMISGGVKCWGSNKFGQLGDGSKIDSYVPVDVR